MADEPQSEAVDVVVEHTPARDDSPGPGLPARRVSGAPLVAFLLWVAAVGAVAVARVDPWERGASWSKWLTADQRGWELVVPGFLAAAATALVLRAQVRWTREGWSPIAVAFVAAAAAAGAGAALWGLYCLDLGPWAL
ncbi:MAG: hypothetical protein KQH83_01905 [Actinobacteria bacterium]|nr:hypothetical protein [Actinomycetota bacterium]